MYRSDPYWEGLFLIFLSFLLFIYFLLVGGGFILRTICIEGLGTDCFILFYELLYFYKGLFYFIHSFVFPFMLLLTRSRDMARDERAGRAQECLGNRRKTDWPYGFFPTSLLGYIHFSLKPSVFFLNIFFSLRPVFLSCGISHFDLLVLLLLIQKWLRVKVKVY